MLFKLPTIGRTAVRKKKCPITSKYRNLSGSPVNYVLRQESAISLLLSQVGKLECYWQAYGKNKEEKERGTKKKEDRRDKISDI